jgi:secreted Zn-dependent insulinase-like peptidase
MAGFFAGGTLFERLESMEERRAALEAVTAENVREVAAILAEPSRLNVIAVGLLENDEDKRLADAVKRWADA